MKKTLYSIRMRASKNARHISGAEGIYSPDGIDKALLSYSIRALGHPRGKPDNIVLTVERLKVPPKAIAALDVCTVACKSPHMAKNIAGKLLNFAGVSTAAFDRAFRIFNQDMSGAAIFSAKGGHRLDKDRREGVRVSHIGMDEDALADFKRRLSRRGINTPTVREAVILASKVSSAPGIVAELCISDDPGYTTGYVASNKFGYVRIPNIKRPGAPIGGRVFFYNLKTGIDRLAHYLKQKPVLVSIAPKVSGERSLDEIIDNPDS